MEILKKVFSKPVKILGTLVAVMVEGCLCSALVSEITNSSTGSVVWSKATEKPDFSYIIIVIVVISVFHISAYFAEKAIKNSELDDDALAAFMTKKGYGKIADEMIKAVEKGDTSKIHTLIDLNKIIKDGRKK